MDDIKYEYYQDLKEKKKTATGAKHKNVRHRRPMLSSDNMSKKEWKKMNGLMSEMDLGKRYTWRDLRLFDSRLIVEYINNLVRRFGCNGEDILKVLDISYASWYRHKKEIEKETGIDILIGKRKGVNGMPNDTRLAFVNFLDPEFLAPINDLDEIEEQDEGPDEPKALEQSWSPTPSEIIIRYSRLDSMENDIINEVKKRLAAEMYELLSRLKEHEEIAVTISLSKTVKD